MTKNQKGKLSKYALKVSKRRAIPNNQKDRPKAIPDSPQD